MNSPLPQSPLAISVVWAIVLAAGGQIWTHFGSESTEVDGVEQTVPQPNLVELDPPDSASREVQIATHQSELAEISRELQIQELETSQKIAAARLQVELAKADLNRYLEAEIPTRQRQLDSECGLAAHNHRQAEEQCDYFQRLSRKGYCKHRHVQKAAVDLSTAWSALKTAEEKRTTYLEHTHPRRLLELEGAVQAKQCELELTQEKADLTLAKLRARRDQKSHQLSKFVQPVI